MTRTPLNQLPPLLSYEVANGAYLGAVAAVLVGYRRFFGQPAPGTLVMTLGKDGAPVSTRVYTVSRDRKSMTETIIWAGTAMPKLETNLFHRIG